MSSIAPSIGRKVWFFSGSTTGAQDPKQAFDATVIFVHNPTTVNLVATNHWGTSMSLASVQLRDPTPEDTHGKEPFGYATWMPYQVGQAGMAAAKKEAREEEAGK